MEVGRMLGSFILKSAQQEEALHHTWYALRSFNMENHEGCHQVQTGETIGESFTRSSYKGVMRPSGGKWTVELIDPLKNRYHLGAYNSLDEATTIYNNIASELSQKAEPSASRNLHDMDLSSG
ncbi:unnamed protein product [Spirodela intermedia]|uniref:AP2/ERF domain-containing protein n=1 Tax=Spirodela intermedia TaxID=51605 RepID=A0A7I8LAA5_SPIIN|nr:unnamed protein product [Spirodela intermedia]